MATLATFLMSMAGSLAIRVLMTLGMGLLVFEGVNEAIGDLMTAAQTHWSAIPAAILGLASMAGVPQGLGIVAGALTARVAAWVAVKATSWLLGAK